MKHSFILGLIVLLFCSCGTKDLSEEIQFIGGYWEIKSVEMADGSTKTFTVNTSVDYIQIQGDSGVRKKLMPQLDGSFKEFPTSEKFKFHVRNDSLLMHYSTPYANWMETVVKSTKDQFIVKNKDGKEFVYARFEKMNLDY